MAYNLFQRKREEGDNREAQPLDTNPPAQPVGTVGLPGAVNPQAQQTVADPYAGKDAALQSPAAVNPVQRVSSVQQMPQGVSVLNDAAVGALQRQNAPSVGNDYVQRFQSQQAQVDEARRKQYVHDKDKPARGFANWVNSNLTDAEQVEKRRNAIRMINALGMMGRHAANLASVSRGATPQQIQDQVAMQDAQWVQGDAAKAAAQQKAAELALKQSKADAEAQYKDWQMRNGDANTRIKMGELGIAQDKNARENNKHPLELQRMAQDIVRLEAQGRKADADALKAQVDASDAHALNMALKRQRDASAASSYAHASQANATTRKINEEIRNMSDGKNFHVPVKGNEKQMFAIPNSDKNAVYNALYKHAKESGWVSEQKDEFTGMTKRPSQNELIKACMEHWDDDEVQRVFNQYGKRTDSKMDYKL